MRKELILSALAMLLGMGGVQAQMVMDLQGPWDFALGDSAHYDDYVVLPGSLLTNDKGHYVGNAWYRRYVYIPKEWSDQRITLFLERPHIETTVFVNGREVGHQLSLSVPHRYDVTKYVRKGERNEIAIRVYNGIENVCVGQDSHSVTDQTQGNWNGITGRIELQAQWKKLNIKQVRITPHTEEGAVTVEVKLENHVDGLRFFPINDYNVTANIKYMHDGKVGKMVRGSTVIAEGSNIKFKFYLGRDVKYWDEFHPNLYRLTVEAGETVYETQFGLREIKARDKGRGASALYQ